MSSRSLPKGAPQPGAILAEKYRIDRVIGAGGMGYVLAATHLHLHETVAIKMLLPRHVEERTVLERFLREGRAAVKIRSEHVVRVMDVDTLEDGTPYLVMEYLDGIDLSVLLHREIRLEPARAVDYVLQALEAVAKAHSLRMVHRDLKPSNLFLTRSDDGSDCIKVLDFGISKVVLTDADVAVTKTTDALGTPLYMSPEQLKNSRDVDERADIWALGVVLFELIAGGPPFKAESFAELGALVLSGNVPSLVMAAPHVEPVLGEIVATCLRLAPSDRFVNAADLADALVPFGGPDARARADRIIRTVGMPATRAKRLTGSSLVATMPHASAAASVSSLPQTTRPISSDRASTPVAEAVPHGRTTLSSSVEANGNTGSRSHRPAIAFVAIPLLVAVLGGGGFAAYRLWGREPIATSPAVPGASTSPPIVTEPSAAPIDSAAAAAVAQSATGVAVAPSATAVAVAGGPPAGGPPTPARERLDAGAPPRDEPGTSSTATRPPAVKPTVEHKPPPAKSAVTSTVGVTPPRPSARPPKECDPPYTIDQDGTKRWKPACL